MRVLGLALLFVLGCRDKPPAPPDPARFQKMTPDERCAAAAPRALRCIGALQIADLRQLNDPELANQVAEQLRKSPPPDAKEARVLHETMCLGSPRYADAVVACWNASDCDALTACVREKTK